MTVIAWGLGLSLGLPLAGQDETVLFLSARSGSLYHQIAESVGEQVQGVQAVTSAGSFENLARLERGEGSFALAQQDVVSEYVRDRVQRGHGSRVRVVGRVFFDYLHIFVRRPIHVERASDFRRFRIWLGEEESGTRRTAVRFMESVGVPLSSLYEESPASLDELFPLVMESDRPGEEQSWVDQLPSLFRAETLDVAMVMTTPGVDSVCRAMKSGRMSLFPLGYQTLRLLTNELESATVRRQIAIGNIPAGTYVGQEEAVPTIAVPTLLVAHAGVSGALAGEVLRTAQDRWTALAGTRGAEGCRYLKGTPPVGSLSESNLEMLDGFEDDPSRWHDRVRAFTYLLLAMAACLLAAWVARQGWHHNLAQLWRQEKGAARAVVGLGLGVLLVTLFTYILERRINEDFSSPWESFWSITIYLFSGLEDRNPYTPAGRLVAAFGLLLGPLFFAFLTGWLARVFIRWEARMPHNLKGHCLLLNWNERAVRVVRELHHEVVAKSKGVQVIVVLTDDESLTVRRLKGAGMGEDKAFEDVYLSIGDPTSEKALLNANAQDAKTVVLLADDSRLERADERTIRSLVMLSRIARTVASQEVKGGEPEADPKGSPGKGRKGLHVIVELVDSANEKVVDEIARDFPGMVERVSGLQVRTCLIAQAALSEGVTELYQDLLRVSEDTNEVYTQPIPSSAVGMTFRDYAATVLAQETDNPLIPLGVQRLLNGTSRMFSNPRPGQEGYLLEEGDDLVVMAYEPPKTGALPAP